MELAAVAVGGAIGALLRYLLQGALNDPTSFFPYGTALANLIGCFVAGYLAALSLGGPAWIRPLVFGGVLGALTTMSAFALELNDLGDQDRLASAFAYWFFSAVLCMGACLAGLKLGKL